MVRLALDPGRVVTTRQLVDALWGDGPPAGATNALQALVSRLRRAVPDLVVESQPAGYRLALDPTAVDAYQFEALLKQSDVESVPTALPLWRGPASPIWTVRRPPPPAGWPNSSEPRRPY